LLHLATFLITKRQSCQEGRTQKLSSTSWAQFHQHFMQSFYVHRSQKHKKAVKLSVFFALLGFARVKASRRTLVRSTPDDKECVRKRTCRCGAYLVGVAPEPCLLVVVEQWRPVITSIKAWELRNNVLIGNCSVFCSWTLILHSVNR